MCRTPESLVPPLSEIASPLDIPFALVSALEVSRLELLDDVRLSPPERGERLVRFFAPFAERFVRLSAEDPLALPMHRSIAAHQLIDALRHYGLEAWSQGLHTARALLASDSAESCRALRQSLFPAVSISSETEKTSYAGLGQVLIGASTSVLLVLFALTN